MADSIFINCIEVPEGRDDEFLEGWRTVHRYMQKQDGYISTRLHKSLKPDADFRYVNIAKFKNPPSFLKAISTEEFKELTAGDPFKRTFSLYEVFETDEE